MSYAQSLDIQDVNAHIHSAGQAVAHYPHRPFAPNEFLVLHLDALDGCWEEGNAHRSSDWMQSQIQELHFNAAQQKGEIQGQVNSEGQSSWPKPGLDEDKSKQLLMDLLHQESNPPIWPSDVYDRVSLERSRIYYGHNAFIFGLQRKALVLDEQNEGFERGGKLPLRSSSARLNRGTDFSGANGTSQAVYFSSNMVDRLCMYSDFVEVEGEKHPSKINTISKASGSGMPISIAKQTRIHPVGGEEFPTHTIVRQNSIGVFGDLQGFYNDKIGLSNCSVEAIANNRVPTVLSRGSDESVLLEHPLVSCALSSQEALSELASDPVS